MCPIDGNHLVLWTGHNGKEVYSMHDDLRERVIIVLRRGEVVQSQQCFQRVVSGSFGTKRYR